MSALTRRETKGLFPDLLDWIESPLLALRPLIAHPIRLEDYIRNGRYVVRAELPGLDPGKQLGVIISRGTLTIHAERHEDTRTKHRSEFHYGVFSRHISLPSGADEDDVNATYDKGILEISVGLKEQENIAGQQVRVTTASRI